MDEGNNNNNNREELLRLQDLNHYIEANGIEAANDNRNGADGLAAEAALRELAAHNYQTSVFESIFDEDEDAGAVEGKRKEEFLKEIQKKDPQRLVISLKAKNGVVLDNLPLAPLVQSCDTIFGLAHTHFHVQRQEEEKGLDISLEEFSDKIVRQFLDMIYSPNEADASDISADDIVEFCRLAHFLQSPTILHDIVTIIESSIDGNNCMAICALADQLDLPQLFESALSFMLCSLDEFQDNEYWSDLPAELQNRMLTMRNAIQSSILARGRRSKAFFSSTQEFLAIFAENIQYQKERLREAKERQQEVIVEQRIQDERRIRRAPRDPMSSDMVQYTKSKIEAQERRITTLEMYYAQQKIMFQDLPNFVNNDQTDAKGFLL